MLLLGTAGGDDGGFHVPFLVSSQEAAVARLPFSTHCSTVKCISGYIGVCVRAVECAVLCCPEGLLAAGVARVSFVLCHVPPVVSVTAAAVFVKEHCFKHHGGYSFPSCVPSFLVEIMETEVGLPETLLFLLLEVSMASFSADMKRSFLIYILP